MPAVSTGIALVTGANGYVAVWAIKQLLEQGYSVRGTLRCMSKADHLRTIFHDFVNRLEFVVVEDFTKVTGDHSLFAILLIALQFSG